VNRVFKLATDDHNEHTANIGPTRLGHLPVDLLDLAPRSLASLFSRAAPFTMLLGVRLRGRQSPWQSTHLCK
jgi:hypothetical protein